MYSLFANSITNWDGFPNSKTVKLRSEIDQFMQASQIIYKGLRQQNRTMVESMCHRNFLSKSSGDAREFLEELVQKTM